MKLVRTPEPGHTGYVGNVHFADGEATVADDAQEMTYFQAAGYLIEDLDDAGDDLAPADVDGDGVADALPKRSASTEEWRAFAAGHGMTEEQAAGLSRDQLVEHFTKEAGQ